MDFEMIFRLQRSQAENQPKEIGYFAAAVSMPNLLGNRRSAGFRRIFRVWQSDSIAGILDVSQGNHKAGRERNKADGTSEVSEEVYNSSKGGDPAMAIQTLDPNDLDRFFVKSELIPAICFEADTKTVLMLAYMNKESLRRTLETGCTWFWSRSRQEYWNKGATSGHVQKVVSIFADCDDDTLLVNVRQTGVACHTGEYSCFFKELYNDQEDMK